MVANREDLARQIKAKRPDLKIRDIKDIIALQEDVIVESLKQGVDVKPHKLIIYSLETKPAKRAYDGLHKRYFDIPEKTIVKVKFLKKLKEALL